MSTSLQRSLTIGVAVCATYTLLGTPTQATTTCTFTDDVGTMTRFLDGDCTTDETLFVPDGWTLDGQGHTITAEDPPGDHFRGAVVQNAGSEAHVTNLGVTASALDNVCDDGDDRLRGIMFDGASGSIIGNDVEGINQGQSGCQEGNGIEVRNAPFDGTHPDTQVVDISHNLVDMYQKTGIIANGDVDVGITNNFVGSARLEDFIAANSVQAGFGAFAAVNNNEIIGNEWDGASSFAATAVLIFSAEDVNVNNNVIRGDGGEIATDVGVLALFSATVNVMNNDISRDAEQAGEKDDFGVGVWFFDNDGKSKVVRNRFNGWLIDFQGEDLAKVNSPSFP